MAEKRLAGRDMTTDHDVRTLVELPDGSVLDGRVADVSVGGARVAGPATGLTIGDEVRLVFVFRTNERVAYRGQVKHIDPEGRFFGLEFKSDPQPIEVHDT